MTTTIKAATLAVGLSRTNGTPDTALNRRLAYNKAGEVPAEIRKAVQAKIEEVLAKIKPEHTKMVLTFYVPKVELA